MIAARTKEYEARVLPPFAAAERGTIDDVIMPHVSKPMPIYERRATLFLDLLGFHRTKALRMSLRHWQILLAALVLSIGAINGVEAQEGAHKFLGKFGAWNIISNLNAVTMSEGFWMGAKSINDPKAALSVECSKETRTYSFVISSVNLKYLPRIEKMTIQSRAENGKPISLLAASSGTGNVVVYQTPAEGSFNRLLALIFLPEPTPKTIGFSVGSSQLFFPLDDFVTAIANLSVHCGFYPDPKMGTGR